MVRKASVSEEVADILATTWGEEKMMAEWIVEIKDGFPHLQRMTELVRCGNCKHFPVGRDRDGWVRWPEDKDGFEDEACPCFCEDGYYSKMPPENGYCYKGERREK